MSNPALETPQLADEDWILITHLLEIKQRDLLAEIRHTDKRAFREALHERLDQVERLLRQMPVPAVIARTV
ncbi:MAG: hypothetical protein HY821_14560 [Acidobacteria bacterium]|nr:hypothetical protein [Acidobacteriota bacterium]